MWYLEELCSIGKDICRIYAASEGGNCGRVPEAMVDADWRPHGDICDSRFLRCGDLSAGAAGPRTCRVGISDVLMTRSDILDGQTAWQSTGGMQIGSIRSEEHTSELQSLMRISYADFCLKKKT